MFINSLSPVRPSTASWSFVKPFDCTCSCASFDYISRTWSHLRRRWPIASVAKLLEDRAEKFGVRSSCGEQKKGKGNFGHMLKQPCMHVKRRKPSSKYFSLLFYYFFIFVYSKMSLNRSDYFLVPSVYIRHQVDELLYTFFIFRLLPAHYSLKISKNSFSHSISSFLLCFYSRIHFLISREREIC